MAIITMLKAIKEVHSKSVVLIKIGGFYHAYGKDAYILSYFFGYKIKKIEGGCANCGFPINSISKVKVKLEDSKINYILLDRRNNYEEDEKFDLKNLNKYAEIYEKARKYVNLKNRIESIYEILLDDVNKEELTEKIIRIEEIVYERRKI